MGHNIANMGGFRAFGGQPASAAARPPLFVGATDNAAGGTSKIFTYPAGIEKDDIILAAIGGDGAPGVTWPAEFTELYDTAGSGFISAAWTRALGGETGTFEATTGVSEDTGFGCIVFRGAHLTSAPEAAGAEASGSSNLPDPPSFQPTWNSSAAEPTMWVTNIGWDVGSTGHSAYPTGYTAWYARTSGSTFGGGSAGSYKGTFDVQTEDPGNHTITNSRAWRAQTIAIRAATATSGEARLIEDDPVTPRGTFRITEEGNHRITG